MEYRYLYGVARRVSEPRGLRTFGMILSDLENTVFNNTKHRAASLRQLSFLLRLETSLLVACQWKLATFKYHKWWFTVYGLVQIAIGPSSLAPLSMCWCLDSTNLIFARLTRPLFVYIINENKLQSVSFLADKQLWVTVVPVSSLVKLHIAYIVIMIFVLINQVILTCRQHVWTWLKLSRCGVSLVG